MADPLGIITSTLHAAHKVYEIVKTIKDAPEEIQALQDQAQLLDSILPGISDFLQRAGESTSMSLLAAKAGELNASVERFLNKATKMSPRGERKVKKLKWWFNADEAKSLTGKLSVFYGALSAVYSIESSHIHTSFSELDVRLEESFASTNDRLSGCFTEVHTHLDTQLVGVREIFQEELAKTSEELMHALLVSRACELRTLANQQRRGEGHGFDQNSVLFNTDYVVQATSVLPDFRGQAEGSSTSTRPDYAPSTMVPGYPPPSISPLETPCKHCSCQCHRAACLLRTPKSVSSIIGDHYAKIPFPHRVWPGLVQCDVPTCKKGWLMQVKSFLPYWFARVEMQMRFEVLPVHFCIQTPRFNPEIDYKMAETVPERGADVFKELLYSRRATINDVNEHGLGLLHLAVYYIGDVADSDDRQLNNVIDAVSYLLEVGVSLEWQDVHSRTPQEQILLLILEFGVERASQLRMLEQIQVRLIGPLFQDDLKGITTRGGLTELHQRLVLPGPRLTAEDLMDLMPLLNTPDREGRTPLYYAIHWASYAVEMLLNAGADLQLVKQPLGLAIVYSDSTVIGPLIHAGADVNERIYDRSTPLIWTMKQDTTGKRRCEIISELARHAGDKIDWDARDIEGKTALDYALEVKERLPTEGVRMLKRRSRRDILEHDRGSVMQVGNWEWTYGDGVGYEYLYCISLLVGEECTCPRYGVENTRIREEGTKEEEFAMPGSFK